MVIVHGGHEHFQLPSPRMKETYQFFVDAGADAVVNHHQHCYSGYEIYKNKPIFYGLGNFLFDNAKYRNSIWNEGFTVEISFNNSNNPTTFFTHPYKQCNEEVGVKYLTEQELHLFNERLSSLNEIIFDKNKLILEHSKWMEKTSKEYELVLQPFRSRITDALFRRHFFPSFLSLKRKALLYNFISCESHVERLLQALNKF